VLLLPLVFALFPLRLPLSKEIPYLELEPSVLEGGERAFDFLPESESADRTTAGVRTATAVAVIAP